MAADKLVDCSSVESDPKINEETEEAVKEVLCLPEEAEVCVTVTCRRSEDGRRLAEAGIIEMGQPG